MTKDNIREWHVTQIRKYPKWITLSIKHETPIAGTISTSIRIGLNNKDISKITPFMMVYEDKRTHNFTLDKPMRKPIFLFR